MSINMQSQHEESNLKIHLVIISNLSYGFMLDEFRQQLAFAGSPRLLRDAESRNGANHLTALPSFCQLSPGA
ncbi:uncharacterized [Tachysurus ichikawai]